MPVRFLCSIHKEATCLSADSCDGASFRGGYRVFKKGGLRPARRNAGGEGGGGVLPALDPTRKAGGGGCCPLQARYEKRGGGGGGGVLSI